jgi:heterotetrameric sarcosine oxidase alpha subunit
MRLRPPPDLVRFTFDGQSLQGVAGEPVAAALLAHGIRLVGRSFKYHRPRGIFSAGSEEPNALVTIGRGGAVEPNQRATMVPVSAGLVVQSQNAWPSLRYDALAINDLLAPVLGAGFYYKTFMWPRDAWRKLYEPLIRKAAGLGALSGQADPDDYEKAFGFCDLLVIGAGPAGLMAAWTAAQAGADVILADEDSALGGRLLREREMIAGQPADQWAAQMVAQLADLPNVRLMTRTTITGVYDHGTFAAFEQGPLGPAGTGARACFWRIVAKAAVLAAGAVERPIAFAGNDRPGVMLAGAVRSYVNRWAVTPGQRVVVFGNNDDAHRSARDLAAAGVQVVALVDSRDDVTLTGDYPCYTGAYIAATAGRHGLTHVTLTHQGGTRVIRCDCLAVSGGWNPNVHLTCHLGARPVWRDDIAAFVPRAGAVAGLEPAGACNGTFDTAGCLREGATVAAALVRNLGFKPKVTLPDANADPVAISPLWLVHGKGRKWIDLQNDVTVSDIASAAQESFRSVEHMKRYTTQGMAPDQGKSSNVLALAVLGELTGQTPAQTGTTTFRPPYVPVPIAAMGAGGQGMGFAPRCLTPAHHAASGARAPMIATGLWYRPSYFPLQSETGWRQSCDRETGYVRQSVGVCDVSSLGKIDVQGPDAAAFLDFVYANAVASLAQGKVRYGVMLREDGHVMDDGTITRLGQGHFLLTTTTAATDQVWRHLQFVTQVLRPEWDVRLTDVTDQWAQFAVSGPKARVLLESMRDDAPDAQAADVPFMGFAQQGLGGVAARVFRISFSGELGYEIAVPARYGESLFRQLVAQARTLGGGPYGLEALNVLRIEKGFLTHAEMHGRVTAGDLGLAVLVDTRKDCIGQAAARRPGLLAVERPQLIGLRGVEKGRRLTAGAHLFAAQAKAVSANDQGYITSACYSPTLGAYLALGFLQNGRARHGEVIRMVDHLRGVDTLAQVCAPQFYDPDGGRARG